MKAAVPAVLEVLLHDRPVGTLTLLPGERILFAFQEDYIADAARPTLSLCYKKESGGLRTELPISNTHLPSFFSNLLPEGPLREALARLGGVDASREFPLLALLGEDLPGAIRVRPLDGNVAVLEGTVKTAIEPDKSSSVLRFSLAGVQLKFSAILEPRGGLTIPVSGIGGDWIVKLPSMTFSGVAENEFAIMNLAGLIGIEIPEIRLVDTHQITGIPVEMTNLAGQGATLAVRRFDRAADSRRIHMEDMAQVFERRPQEKYQGVSAGNIARLLFLEAGTDSLVEFIRRLVFTIATGNADMHLKNWSLIYPDGRTPRLSPAYDLLSTIVYLPDPDLALSIGGTKRMRAITVESFERLARKAQLPQRLVIHTVTDTIERFRETWKAQAGSLLLQEALIRQIESHFTALPLFKG